MKLRVGDRVKIISGREKGKFGYIKKIFHSKNKALVDGLKLNTKHQKPGTIEESGSILKKESPIDISNIMLYDSKFKIPTRILAYRFDLENSSVRFSVKTGTILK